MACACKKNRAASRSNNAVAVVRHSSTLNNGARRVVRRELK